MSSHIYIADSGYHQLLYEDIDDVDKETFFNGNVNDYHFSSTQFRFSLPGQHLTDDYRRHIRGYFQNEPCIYNHEIFSYAARFFEVMKHAPEALQAASKVMAPAAQTTFKSVAQAQTTRARRAKQSRRNTFTPGNLTASQGILSSFGKNTPRVSMLTPRVSVTSVTSPRSSTSRQKFSNDLQLPDIEFTSENEKRLTYQLVFQTLKCKIYHISA